MPWSKLFFIVVILKENIFASRCFEFNDTDATLCSVNIPDNDPLEMNKCNEEVESESFEFNLKEHESNTVIEDTPDGKCFRLTTENFGIVATLLLMLFSFSLFFKFFSFFTKMSNRKMYKIYVPENT